MYLLLKNLLDSLASVSATNINIKYNNNIK